MHADQRELFGRKRNDEIEILRGLAISFVLIDHIMALCNIPEISALENYFSFWGGVDLFFAISGFVISLSVLRASSAVTSKSKLPVLVNFLIKRVWRLWPASWFWLIIPLIAALILLPEFRHGEELRAMISSFIGGFINIVNIQQWHFNSGFGMQNIFWSTYWSLSLEEQFYLVTAPLLIWAPKRVVIGVMVVLILVQFPMVRPANSSSLWWFIRSDAFAWGVLLALFWESPISKRLVEPTLLRQRRYAWPILGLLLVTIVSTQLLYSIPFDVGLIAIASAALVFIASFDNGYLGIGGLIGRVLSWIGDRSYAIYLVHPAIIAIALRVGPLSHLNRSSAADLTIIILSILLISLILAELSYHFIEVPARLHGRKLAKAYITRAIAMEPSNSEHSEQSFAVDKNTP